MAIDLSGNVLLTDGNFATVDSQDLAAVLSIAKVWIPNARPGKRVTYAQANVKKNGRWTTISLHRFVGLRMGLDPKFQVEHEDHDGLNCRRFNLRPATNTENAMNRRKCTRTRSGFKGVYKNKLRWAARITVNGKDLHLGLFVSKIEAAETYNRAAIKYFGTFACINDLAGH